MTGWAWALVGLALLLGLGPGSAPARTAALGARGRLDASDPRRRGRRGGGRWVPGRADVGSGAARGSGAAAGFGVARARGSGAARGGACPAAVTVAAVVAVGVTVALTSGAILALAAVLVAVLVLRMLADVRARRRARSEHTAVLAAVRILIAELVAGSLPAAALAAAATAAPPVRETFERAAAQAAQGDPCAVLVADPRPGVRAVGVAFRLGQDTGSALGPVLERVAGDLAAADAQRRAVTVALAGPRSSAVLVALLPVLGLGLGTTMGASPVAVLGGSPAGRLLCLVGVALDVAGVFWIRLVLRRAERP